MYKVLDLTKIVWYCVYNLKEGILKTMKNFTFAAKYYYYYFFFNTKEEVFLLQKYCE